MINVCTSRAALPGSCLDMSGKFNCIHGKQRLIQMRSLELQIGLDGLEVQVQCLCRQG